VVICEYFIITDYYSFFHLVLDSCLFVLDQIKHTRGGLLVRRSDSLRLIKAAGRPTARRLRSSAASGNSRLESAVVGVKGKANLTHPVCLRPLTAGKEPLPIRNGVRTARPSCAITPRSL